MDNQTLDEDLKRILTALDIIPSEEPNNEPLQEIYLYVEEDRITVLKRPEQQPQIIEAVEVINPQQQQQQQPTPYFAYITMIIGLLLIFYLVTSAIITIFFPPTAIVTIIPKSQTVSLTGTLQLGRLLQPITIRESQTVSTTGKGHQDARSAIGYITFYNGLFTSQTLQAGTVLTGAGGVQIITDQTAFISAANPPSLGYATVSAHAQNPDMTGNIVAYDVVSQYYNLDTSKRAWTFSC